MFHLLFQPKEVSEVSPKVKFLTVAEDDDDDDDDKLKCIFSFSVFHFTLARSLFTRRETWCTCNLRGVVATRVLNCFLSAKFSI
jgi:hypothetical protein